MKLAFLHYDTWKKGRHANADTFWGSKHFGPAMLRDVLRKKGHEVQVCTPDTARNYDVGSNTSGGQLLRVLPGARLEDSAPRSPLILLARSSLWGIRCDPWRGRAVNGTRGGCMAHRVARPCIRRALHTEPLGRVGSGSEHPPSGGFAVTWRGPTVRHIPE